MKDIVFSKITIDSFMGPFTIIAEIIGEYQNGYNTESGAWCRYSIPGEKLEPAIFLKVREKGKHKNKGYNKKSILKVEPA